MSTAKPVSIDKVAFILSGGFIVAFAALALIDINLLSKLVKQSAAWSTSLFGAYWQILLLSTFFVAIAIACGRSSKAILGNLATPDISTFKWLSMIMCTLLAGGGIFFAAAEPIAHFLSPPPLFNVEASSPEAAYPALAQSFLHWGFLSWTILGSLATIILMHLHYKHGFALKPRLLLYPVFGEKIIHSQWGSVIDAVCIIAVVAGTVGPVGFAGLQVSSGLDVLFGIENQFSTQALVIVCLISLYTLSTLTGITKGIQILSTLNIVLATLLLIFILLAGPTGFIVDSYIQSNGTLISNFIAMTTFRQDAGWLDSWTVFFWGWFLGYGPIMALFIARISNGRSIRELIIAVSFIAPLVTAFWFTIIGGTGIAFELADPGIISKPFEGFNMPAVLLAITQQLPWGYFISCLFILLAFLFVATTGDSMTYTLSMVVSGNTEPATSVRLFWGLMMGVLAIILVAIGSGGIGALQSFIIITAVPVSLILLPSIWTAPKAARELAKEQGLL